MFNARRGANVRLCAHYGRLVKTRADVCAGKIHLHGPAQEAQEHLDALGPGHHAHPAMALEWTLGHGHTVARRAFHSGQGR